MAQKIIIAEGLDARDMQGVLLLDLLNSEADPQKGSKWTFPKGAKTPTVEVEVVFTIAEFQAALDTPDAYVIYEGHSRFGSGPSFGDANMDDVPDVTKYPVNPWGVHFRMGYDATDTECFGDIVKHSILPTEFNLLAATKKSFLPGLLKTARDEAQAVAARQKANKLTAAQKKDPCSIPWSWREFAVCQPKLAAITTARKDEPLKSRHYFVQQIGVRKRKTPPDEFLMAVEVGSADLNNVWLKCKVLLMNSCSSQVHYFEPLDKRRKAAKSKCKFFLTAEVCSASSARNFVEEVFKGTDPSSEKGAKTMKSVLNGFTKSGAVGVY